MDPDLVYVTTRLEGPGTDFLPFNKGKYGGAGNPPVQQGYATRYLWERVWARDSMLNLIQDFKARSSAPTHPVLDLTSSFIRGS